MKDEEVTMHYKTFATHKYIKSLQESGFNEKQAEMLVKSLLESRDFDLSILATREQVSKIESNLEKQISATREQVSKTEASLEKQISAIREQVARLDGKIDKVESNLEQKIIELKSELKESISSIKHDMLKWIVPMMLTIIGIAVGIALKLL